MGKDWGPELLCLQRAVSNRCSRAGQPLMNSGTEAQKGKPLASISPSSNLGLRSSVTKSPSSGTREENYVMSATPFSWSFISTWLLEMT
jgi:hypothetical protein